MKNLAQLVLLPLLGIALLPGDVFGSPATASGTHCKLVYGSPNSTYAYQRDGIHNTGPSASPITVACTIPMDSTKLGSTVSFRMKVKDNSTSAGFSCVPYVYDQNGNLIGSGATMTTSASQTGNVTLGGTNWTVSVPGNVNSNVYVIQCSMPGNTSIIYNQRVQ
jgi:hypothetical protein